MNWDAIGALAEAVGAAAVVVSLVYLAVQIRQSNRHVREQIRALRLQSYDSAGADFSNLRLHVSGSPQRASVWRRGKNGYADLEPDEKAQLNEMLHELMWAYQNIFTRMQGGVEDEVLVGIVEKNLFYWMGFRGFRQWWQAEHKTPYTEEFERLVDSVCVRVDQPAAG